MATKKKTKKSETKRTVTCGKCKEAGHNSRSCTKTEAAAKTEVVKSAVTESKVEVTEAPATKKTKVEPPTVAPRPRRAAPTADTGTAATAAPHRCPKCNAVAILVIVRVKDFNETFKKKRDIYKGEMRCEQCMNKPNPAELILVWGAHPNQTVTADEAAAGA